jgi:hypothetical protein
VTFVAAETVPAVAVNVAEVALAATVTEAGMVRAALSLVSETEAPPAGAAALRVMVQVEFAPEVSDVGEQASELMVGSGVIDTVAVFELLL